MSHFRTGFGYDVHQLVPGRSLIIGGVQIPHTKGVLGHSDADVLLHAISDALLGSLTLGDIGQHFPDTDADLKDISSKVILSEVNQMVTNKGYKIANVDSTVILQKPKLSDYILSIRESIAGILNLEVERISVKAKTNEQLGFIGKGEGVAAFAVVLLEELI